MARWSRARHAPCTRRWLWKARAAAGPAWISVDAWLGVQHLCGSVGERTSLGALAQLRAIVERAWLDRCGMGVGGDGSSGAVPHHGEGRA